MILVDLYYFTNMTERFWLPCIPISPWRGSANVCSAFQLCYQNKSCSEYQQDVRKIERQTDTKTKRLFSLYSGGRWSGLCLFLHFGCKKLWWECHGFWRCFLGFLYINFTKIPFLAQKNWCNQGRWRHLWLRIFKYFFFFLKIVFWKLLLILAKK